MIRRAIAWTFLGQIVSFAATFGTTVALARILSPREIGIFAIGASVSGALQALAAFGVGTYVVREHRLTPTVLATAFTLNAIIAVLLALALVAGSFVPAITLGEPMVTQVLRVLALVPLFGIVEFRPAIMLQRDMEFSSIAVITVARTAITAAVSIATALAGASAVSAAYGGAAGAAGGALAFALLARRHNGFRLGLGGWRSMVSFGFQTLAIGGIAMVVVRLSDFLLGRIQGLAALGLYNRAAALASVPITNVYQNLARVMFVKLADEARAGQPVAPSYLRGLEVILGVLWPMLAGLALLAHPVVEILFGAQWLAAATPLALLAIAQMLGLSYAMNYELFVLRDEVARQARIETLRTLLGLAAFAYGCTFGITGAAAGRLVDPLLGMIVYLPHLRRLSGAPEGALVRIYGRALLLVASALAVPALALPWIAAPGALRYAVLAGALAGSGLGWLAMLRAIRHPLWHELVRLAQRARRRPWQKA